jgi:nucleotide-binding universal stress UspA family protein
MITLKTILVPTDFSAASEDAVQFGRALAETFGSTLHLLHVLEHPRLGKGGAERWGFSLTDLVTRLETAAEARMATLVSELGLTDTIERVAQVGEPFIEIIRYAREHEIGMVVMGTHGRGPVAHMLLGSVAEKVVRMAPCPVLTVRHPSHEFVMV